MTTQYDVDYIVNKLEKFAPRHIAETWDNVGLILGRLSAEVTGVLPTIEVTNDAIDFALEKNCNLIVAHHPLMFSKINKLSLDSVVNHEMPLIERLIKENINVFVMHTNFDRAPEALHHYIFQKLKIQKAKRIEYFDKEKNYGYGLVGDLIKPKSAASFVSLLKKVFDIASFRIVLGRGSKISKVAFSSGAGSFALDSCLKLNVDALITGDVRYHEAIKASELGFHLYDIGHYASEKYFCYVVEAWLRKLNFTKKIYPYVGKDPFELV